MRQMAVNNVQISLALELRCQRDPNSFQNPPFIFEAEQMSGNTTNRNLCSGRSSGNNGRTCIAETTNHLSLPAVISEWQHGSAPPSA